MGTLSINNLIVFYIAAKRMESGDLSAILHMLSMLIDKLPRKSAEMLKPQHSILSQYRELKVRFRRLRLTCFKLL